MISSFDDYLAECRNGRMARDDCILGLVAYDSRTTLQTSRINTNTICIMFAIRKQARLQVSCQLSEDGICLEGAAYCII
jgi:hypothetical protein